MEPNSRSIIALVSDLSCHWQRRAPDVCLVAKNELSPIFGSVDLFFLFAIPRIESNHFI
ncbi:hypothetical protein SynA1560_02533 [Synechococcus sp. A15-60]|nr:hypothetical protein SynA1560_02533 [Synechococcus sp. A15-60]